eukprot:TRINITY_DN11031_c0_g1_i3.p1 TRINITY_DN11031_c0_g1~~TRINITY_DN11031_c0_g1_i3.p1  ORF type:complete len:377 (+),score=70.83 TRINITY_DN11031_c0_g1_i3:153-1133(+)
MNKSIMQKHLNTPSKLRTASTTHCSRIITVLNTIARRKSDSHRKPLGRDKLIANKSLSKENCNRALYEQRDCCREVQKIFCTQIKKFEPQNASVSSRIDALTKKSDILFQRPYALNRDDSLKVREQRQLTSSGNRFKNSPQLQLKTSFHKPSKSYTANTSNIYFRTSQNFWMQQPEKAKETYRAKLHKEIDALISDCKEAEFSIPSTKELQRVPCEKRSKNVRWAIKEYLANITSNNWQSKKSIEFLLNLKEAKEVRKRELFDEDMVNRMVKNMGRRALVIPTLGKKRIWKPRRYVPSRKVVLANSIEELNYLYQTETRSQYCGCL